MVGVISRSSSTRRLIRSSSSEGSLIRTPIVVDGLSFTCTSSCHWTVSFRFVSSLAGFGGGWCFDTTPGVLRSIPLMLTSDPSLLTEVGLDGDEWSEGGVSVAMVLLLGSAELARRLLDDSSVGEGLFGMILSVALKLTDFGRSFSFWKPMDSIISS